VYPNQTHYVVSSCVTFIILFLGIEKNSGLYSIFHFVLESHLYTKMQHYEVSIAATPHRNNYFICLCGFDGDSVLFFFFFEHTSV